MKKRWQWRKRKKRYWGYRKGKEEEEEDEAAYEVVMAGSHGQLRKMKWEGHTYYYG